MNRQINSFQLARWAGVNNIDSISLEYQTYNSALLFDTLDSSNSNGCGGS